MMDNATHHSVGQLNPTNATNLNTIQQQNNNNKSPGEPDHFLTIRLLMQGKVSSRFFCSLSRWLISERIHCRKSVVLLENVVIISKLFEKK